MNKKTIAVWFSCGAPSAVAAKLAVERYSKTHNVLVVNNPVHEEDERLVEKSNLGSVAFFVTQNDYAKTKNQNNRTT